MAPEVLAASEDDSESFHAPPLATCFENIVHFKERVFGV